MKFEIKIIFFFMSNLFYFFIKFSLPGDFGFDPLRLSENDNARKW